MNASLTGTDHAAEAHDLRIIFMGTPDFAVPTLEALLALGAVAGRVARVVAVVTQPDRPAGRGGRLQIGPVKAVALEAGVPVLQPTRLRRAENVSDLRALRPDLIVVAAFGQILSSEVLAIPPHGCLNVHASLLPRWRGATPIPFAILAGDTETGVSIMQMDAGVDTGPILAQAHVPIDAHDTTGTLTQRLAVLGAGMLRDSVEPWITGALTPRAQDEAGATVTSTLKREDGHIAWQHTGSTLLSRMVRAYTPWPGAYALLNGRVLKLWDVVALDNAGASAVTAMPGHVLTHDESAPLLAAQDLRWPQVLIVTADGIVRARRVQLEGKRAMSGDEFLRGQPAMAGAQLA